MTNPKDCDMRKRFPEYFYDPDIEKMWKTAIFVPDTCVLLDIFRFPPESSKGLLKILKHLKDQKRLWIPHQFAYEYVRKLSSIRRDIQKDDDERMKDLDRLKQDVDNALRKFDDQTDYELGEQITKIEDIFRTIKKDLQEHRKKHKERLKPEYLEGEIDKLFADRIGAPYNDQELAEIYGEGEWRYKLQRPPGFKDENKLVSRRYGDLIGWLQIIKYAENETRKPPVILVTSDSGGDDWFDKLRPNEKTRGPHPELVKEMHDKAKVDFYLYQTGEFMGLANKYLELDKRIDANAIKEARKREKRVSPVLRRLYMMRGALRSMQRNVDIMREELRLPVQADTLKMHRSLRSMRRNVDIIREELRSPVQSLDPPIIREALRSIQTCFL